ncbi:hypothetical protein CAOG_001107 [Capsaspora owczarzaki ATCC 30864]|uniref:CST complex subunit STN1 n=2 Tax=Capsaspora owczarzaki (strain ATCC 30864) TaxID=595528 RepID=A0A0D2X0U6_CAPO3|nr:hypothetical protein CAOG_001107 [Capsaspora owczarzaki ATCC 30864]
MGIISSIDRYNTNTSYTIDDGTGVISCVVWNRRRAEVTNLAGNATNGAPAALDAVAAVAAAGASAAAAGGGAAGNAPILPVARRAARAGNVFDAPVPAIGELGDLVSVRGKLSCYREQRQLVVTSMTPERAPDAESLWLLECAHLYRKIYSIPFDPAAILGAQSTQTSSTPAHSRAAATQLPVVPLLYGTAAKRPLQPHESQPAAKRWAPYHRNDHS